MESLLLNGRYTRQEAEQLLTKLYKVKTDFHMAKIDTISQSEEDIKHSEKRIKELEDELRHIKSLLKQGNYQHVALRASLSLEFCPDYHNVAQPIALQHELV